MPPQTNKSALHCLQVLCQPISAEQPTGVNLSETGATQALYYQLKDARMAARERERLDVTQYQPAKAKRHWTPVYDLATQCLIEQTKDLEIAVWWLEAAFRLYSYQGLALGFALIATLADTFWAQLYPLPDEDGMITRLQPVLGLFGHDTNSILIEPMINTMLCQCGYTVWQYEYALKIDSLSAKAREAQKIPLESISLTQINAAVLSTKSTFYQDLLAALNKAKQACAQACQMLAKRAPEEAPSKRQITEALDNVTTHIGHLLVNAPYQLDLNSGKAIASPSSDTSNSPTLPQKVPDCIAEYRDSSIEHALMTYRQYRQQSLKTLIGCADFFEQYEPHSPVSYLIRRAVQWGALSFPALQKAMLENDPVLDKLFHQLGIASVERAPTSSTQ